MVLQLYVLYHHSLLIQCVCPALVNTWFVKVCVWGRSRGRMSLFACVANEADVAVIAL